MRRRLLLLPLAAALFVFPLRLRSLPTLAQAQVPGAGELGSLLQEFVDRGFGRSFRELGVERDFDHGHLLFAEGEERPFAVLYHTQELGAVPGADPAARNWLQMIGSRRVEDARRFLRASYPRDAYWEWFRARELPRYREKGTIVWEMLDPGLLGARVASARQWEFSRTSCRSSRDLAIRVPGRGPVCLKSSL